MANSDGLLAYWLMEEAEGARRLNGLGVTARDFVESASAVLQIADSRFGTNSAGFDGVDTAALGFDSVIASSFPGEAANTDYTLGGRVKFNTTTENDLVLSREDSYLVVVSAALDLVFSQRDTDSNPFQISGPAITASDFIDFAMRWQGSTDDEWSAWVSGSKLGTTHTITGMKISANDLAVGAFRTDGTLEMDGHIDELWVFDRALASGEIAHIHSRGIEAFLILPPSSPTAVVNEGYILRTRPTPFSNIHAITMNGNFNNILSTALGTLTSQAIDAAQARRVGLNYNVSGVTGTLDLTVSLEASFGDGEPFHTVNGEAGNTAVASIEHTSVDIGLRQAWWDVTSPVIRFKVTTANLAAGEAISFNGLRAWTQS